MESLVKDKDEHTEVFMNLEGDTTKLNEQCITDEKRITDLEREIAGLEASLDDTITKTLEQTEQFEVASKSYGDTELEVSALIRRTQLLDEETQHVNERLSDIVAKIPAVEKEFEQNERERKVFDAKFQIAEERSEIVEMQLVDATQIADEANRKFDDVERKLRMVEADLERIVDRAEAFEAKVRGNESQLVDDNKKLREFEAISGENGLKEDVFEDQLRDLQENLKNTETKAEFCERTVDKLENTIDHLTDCLYQEKTSYRDMSLQLDATLTDMMGL